MYRSREWLYERICGDRRSDPTVSARALTQRYRVSRNTVAQVLASLVPLKWKKPPRKRVLELVAGVVHALMREDVDALRKQRHTIDQIVQRLAAELGFEHASYSAIRDHVHKQRSQAPTARGVCAVVADRLTFTATLIQTGTDSHRLKAIQNEYRSTRCS